MSARTIRFLLATGLALLLLIAVLGIAYSSGLIWADTSKAGPDSTANTIPPTPTGDFLPPHPSPPPVSTGEPARPTTVQTGGPGIQPSIPSAGPNSPAFTEADVRSFFAQQYANYGDSTVDGGPPQIMDIEFMTVADLQQKLNQQFSLQRPDQALICYVELTGQFPYSHPPSLGQDASPPYLTHVAQVFDAHTGNVLMTVGLDGK